MGERHYALSSVTTASCFYWENPWLVLIQNPVIFQMFLRLMAQEREAILWRRSGVKPRSTKWDVIPWGQIDFCHQICLIACSHVLPVFLCSLFIMNHSKEVALAGSSLCIAVWCTFLGNTQIRWPLGCVVPLSPGGGFTYYSLWLQVLSLLASEMPLVFKGVGFAFGFLRETSQWWLWTPQDVSCTTVWPTGQVQVFPQDLWLSWS